MIEIREVLGIVIFIFLLMTLLGVGMYYSLTVDKSWKPKFHKKWFIICPLAAFVITLFVGIRMDSYTEFLIREEINEKVIKFGNDYNSQLYVNDTIRPVLKKDLITIFDYEIFENHNRALIIGDIKINYKAKDDSLVLNLLQVNRYENLYQVYYSKYKNKGKVGYIETDLLKQFNSP